MQAELDYTSLMRGDGGTPCPHLSSSPLPQTQHFKLLPSSQLISSALLQKFQTKSPSLPENITALKCRAQNRTDALFKCQSRHFINHLHGLPHQGSKKGSRFWLSFIAWRPSVKVHPHYGRFCWVVRCAPSSASTPANCAVPKPRFIRHLCHTAQHRH